MLSLIRQAGSLGQALRPELTQLVRTVASAAGAAGGTSKPVVEKEVRPSLVGPSGGRTSARTRGAVGCGVIAMLQASAGPSVAPRAAATPFHPSVASRCKLRATKQPQRVDGGALHFLLTHLAVPGVPLEPRLIGGTQV